MREAGRGHLAKRLFVFSVSALFFVLRRIWAVSRRLAGVTQRGTCVVLYYHAVRAEHRKAFADQMDLLLRHATPTHVDRTEPLLPGVHYAAVTFDDGYENVVLNALPELRKRQIQSAWFIVSGALGKLAPWLEGGGGCSEQNRILSDDELRNLPDIVTIGSHTVTHPHLPSLKEEDARRELWQSRATLERILNRPITLFSFPHGECTSGLVNACREAGYRRVFTIRPELAFVDSSEFVTGRVSVEPTDWPIEFRLKLSGAYNWLPAAFLLKRRIIGALRGVNRQHDYTGAARSSAV